MIEYELLFLGLLKESQKHGYEIKKTIKEILSIFAGVDLKSIYYPLRILERRGLIAKRIRKKGKRPERFVYYLTARGQERFEELLSKSFLDFKRPQFSLDLSLYFLNYIKPQIARRRLRARTMVLRKLSRDLRENIEELKKTKSPRSLIYILEHNLRMVDSEINFLTRFINVI
ncbi:MAG: PadR family transcriptional regulator [Candidatus Omnitrophica bacterium]|nr:PadR family transcriptional regulator [Candidatus Omnitrophota bacterium]